MVHGGQRPVAPTPPGTFYDSVLASSDSKNPPINFPLPVKAKSSRSIKPDLRRLLSQIWLLTSTDRGSSDCRCRH